MVATSKSDSAFASRKNNGSDSFRNQNRIAINLEFNFPNYKELEYAGYYYGLPINSKGKAKRIKNKEIEIIPESWETVINEYGWGATLVITVKDFKIK